MTVDTAGWLRQKRSAISAQPPRPDAEIATIAVHPLLHLALAVAAEVLVAEVPLGELRSPGVTPPVSPPSSNGTRASTPTLCCMQAGNSSRSGVWSNTL